MAIVTVHLPLPPKVLSPNARPHWAVRSKATKAYREVCCLEFKLAGIARLSSPVTYRQDYYASRQDSRQGLFHPKDEDSAIAATKALRDALQDAGIIGSDSKRNLVIGECRLFATARECNGPGRVVVTLETAD